jgi:phosphoglycolate phosphatase
MELRYGRSLIFERHAMSLHGHAVIFDLDGTLVDTAPDLIGSLNHVMVGEGLPLCPADLARPHVGRGAAALIRVGLAHAGVSVAEDRVSDLTDAFIVHYRVHLADASRPYPGAVEALQELSFQGARLGIATNKRQELSLALLDALGLTAQFTAIAGADTVSARKPDARHLLETAHRLATAPARCIYLGDTRVDERAARAAGLPFVLCPFGYPDQPLHDFHAHAVLDHYAALPDLAARLLLAHPADAAPAQRAD